MFWLWFYGLPESFFLFHKYNYSLWLHVFVYKHCPNVCVGTFGEHFLYVYIDDPLTLNWRECFLNISRRFFM